MSDKILPFPRTSRAWKRGIDLCAEMVDEISETDGADLTLFPDDRDGRPQRNLVLEYLQRLDKEADALTRVAFAAALTDIFASADGAILDANYIREWGATLVAQQV